MKLERNIHFIFLFLLGSRLAFIFSNATNQPALETSEAPQQEIPALTTHAAAPREEAPKQEVLIGNQQEKINLTEDIQILETAYEKNKDPKIATSLIQKLAQNYEFEKANRYLQDLIINPNYDQSIDPTLYIYIAMHDPTIVSITDPQSIQKIIPIMNEYKNNGRLPDDDYNFYQGLIKLRYKDYKGAREIFNGINNPRYTKAIQSITQAISTYNSSKAIPKYYQDALVALALLKNGYFSIAKKLALETALTDNKYILPYQILAYTQFLTNHWEAANDYFLKLADVDTSNKDLYKFLIGIGFYRSKDYDQSILYLSQVTNAELQTDAYRYLLLAYQANDDIKSMTQTRQKLLGQKDTTESDYYDYFYQTFYKPYRTNAKPEIYEDLGPAQLGNKLLADMYLANCATTFTGAQADVCTYGQIGRKLIDFNSSTGGPSTLDLGPILALTSKYGEPYLFTILGDTYRRQSNLTEAEKAYAKALSLSTDSKEQDIIRNKISKLNE